MDALNPLQEFAAFHAWVEGLSIQDWAFLIVVYGGGIVSALWLLRSSCIVAFRLLGLSHPSQFCFFPRLPWRSV